MGEICPRYRADLEWTLYLPGRAGIVDVDLKGGRRVVRGEDRVGNADETTVAHTTLHSSLCLNSPLVPCNPLVKSNPCSREPLP